MMKVYSLYYNNTYVVSFQNKEDVIAFGKKHYGDDAGWDCSIVEEYLSKSPLLYSTPYTPLTPPQSIPCVSPVVSKPPARYTDTYPDIYCGVKADD
jgi:hypothetical protein